jgi:hypothetical protein
MLGLDAGLANDVEIAIRDADTSPSTETLATAAEMRY